jgi:hypothetical protein
MREGQKCLKKWVGNPEGKILLGNLRRIILKKALKNKLRLDWIKLAQDSTRRISLVTA